MQVRLYNVSLHAQLQGISSRSYARLPSTSGETPAGSSAVAVAAALGSSMLALLLSMLMPLKFCRRNCATAAANPRPAG